MCVSLTAHVHGENLQPVGVAVDEAHDGDVQLALKALQEQARRYVLRTEGWKEAERGGVREGPLCVERCCTKTHFRQPKSWNTSRVHLSGPSCNVCGTLHRAVAPILVGSTAWRNPDPDPLLHRHAWVPTTRKPFRQAESYRRRQQQQRQK